MKHQTRMEMEGGVFFKELQMEGSRGSMRLASHAHTFPDLVPLSIPVLGLLAILCFKCWLSQVVGPSIYISGSYDRHPNVLVGCN